ncbi:SDR family NAD(P)-dependent oxidoreductase [Methylobacterium frigidaeris]|uniref:2,5-dichloro-2,5-cyclohexadiene-1,4-diol dehydrogenase LinX n=2 Tax=Methylobacterium frigidaeris TaxID=2038277 RepID=A0AA37M8C6_9HYPH|nr:SDR family NAD(P)-dependent oxidoreductase [Methylobacterium frigidaeris]GJD66024.1 2,5-dichloro-2,5-cyclohexadiene-1,4-diol dehydrogenase LinX [Methylobacterium frigidaeris]
MVRLEGKVAIVTGAGSIGPGWGNGKAAAVAFARQGARIVAMDLDAEAARETADLVHGEGGSCLAIQGDVADAAAVAHVVAACRDAYGRIDILHNNVGIIIPGGAAEIAPDDWNRALSVNLTGMYLTCRSVLPVMEAQGAGAIINVSSTAGIRHLGFNYISYSTTKGAILAFTRSIALECARRGVRANTILPGLMDTPMVQHALRGEYGEADLLEIARQRDERCPMGFTGNAWDVAHAAVFLASDEARYVTGAELVVDGGLTCRSA